MEFLATNFLWFLSSTVVFAVLFVVSAAWKFNKFHNQSKAFMDGGEMPNPFSGALPITICAIGAGVSFLLFVVGVIANFLA